MHGRPYKGLIVDFGGVLTTPLYEAMAAFASSAGIAMEDFVRVALAAYAGQDDALVEGFETGRVSEEDFALAFASRLEAATGRTIAAGDLVRRMFAGLELEETMIAAVEAAGAAGFQTALCSNSWGDALYPEELLERLFDVVVISGRVGVRKPDPRIYALTTERLGLRPEDCIFVDDHPGHLETARSVGMTTVLHRTPAETVAKLESLLGVDLGSRGA